MTCVSSGTNITVTDPSAVITVAGSLELDGTASLPIFVDGVGAGSRFITPASSATTDVTVIIKFATLRGFLDVEQSGGAVLFAPCCGGGGVMSVSDSVFANNYRAFSITAHRFQVAVTRSEFSHHAIASTCSNYGTGCAIDSCYFHDQDGGLSEMNTIVTNSVFMRHTGAAVSFSRSGGSGGVNACLFVNNFVALERDAYSLYAGFTMTDTIVLGGSVGAQSPNAIARGWICGQSTGSLVTNAFATNIPATSVWFGVSASTPAGVALIRGSINDGYHVVGSGVVVLGGSAPANASAAPWPASLAPYYSAYAGLCTPPPDRGFSLANPTGASLFPRLMAPSQTRGG